MFATLKKICQTSIAENCQETSAGHLVSAGAHQFKTLWTRDFCLSVPGLLLADRRELVIRQMDLLISFVRKEDGLLPRGIDSISPKRRVVLNTVGRFLPRSIKDIDLMGALHPEYFGEHHTPAFDSNLLFLLSAICLANEDHSWISRNEDVLAKIFGFYKPYFKEGLISQPAYSDWQDSAKRKGVSLYLNLLYALAEEGLQKLGLNVATASEINDRKNILFRLFFDNRSGLFKNRSWETQFSLETQLWAIESDLFTKMISRDVIYQSLKKHPLWNNYGMPGVPVWPEYPASKVSWTTRLVGLRGYHCQLFWSWLIGESAKISFLMKDFEEGQRLLNQLQTVALSEGTIHEVYKLSSGRLKPFRTLLYSSESPFTWGAAKTIEAIERVH